MNSKEKEIIRYWLTLNLILTLFVFGGGGFFYLIWIAGATIFLIFWVIASMVSTQKATLLKAHFMGWGLSILMSASICAGGTFILTRLF